MKVKEDINDPRRLVRVTIVYSYDDDSVEVESEFKDPNHTLKLLQLGIEEFLNKVQGLYCPSCDAEVNPKWTFCSSCGQDL